MAINLKISVRRKIALGIFCFLVLTQIAFAQEGWNSLPRAGDGDLVSVFFTSSEKGWVGGDGGYLAMTTDGGKSWTKQPIGTTENVNEIYFRNDDNGYVLAGTKIFLTKNGGKAWRQNNIINVKDYKGLTPEFLSVRFMDKKRGWIVGSISNQRDEVVDSLILHTVDGGETWSRIITSFKQELYHLDFVNDTDGWIVGAKGLVLTTNDGGDTWTRQSTGTTISLYNVDFRDSLNGVIVGSGGLILRTENGGVNWEKIRVTPSKSLLRVNFTNDQRGWIVGAGGMILTTADKGKTWNKQNSNTPDSLYGLYVDKKVGWAVGKKGIILKYQK